MKGRRAPRFAVALLERYVPDSEPLIGDLLEGLDGGRSTIWLWMQVLAALAAAREARSGEIRPLRLVDLQPADAAERTRRFALLSRPVNLNPGPASGVGGLGLAIFAGVLTVVEPGAWWILIASALAGCACGVLLIVVRDRSHTA